MQNPDSVSYAQKCLTIIYYFMKKTLLSLTLGAMFTLGVSAQDVDYTNQVINNSYEYAWQGQIAGAPGADTPATGWKNSNSWRPRYASNTSGHNTFYGWDVTDWSCGTGTNDAQSLEKGGTNIEGTFDICIFGNGAFPAFWELSQNINGLPAGTYKVQARLAVDPAKRTTQRLFANNNVQYQGTALNYVKSQFTAGEINTFAGYTGSAAALEEMIVYTTIVENQPLKIGIRTGGKKIDGTMAVAADPLWGGFRADYFRVTKLDPASPQITDAALTALSVNAVTGACALSPAFDPEVTTYSCVLPKGTKSVTPKLQNRFQGATISGASAVDVSSGSGVSTIVVTAVDGVTTKTYTINYSIAANGLTDLTNLIINNSFEYASDGTLLDADGDQVVDDVHAGKGKDNNGYRVKNSVAKEYYNWSVTNWDFATTTNVSQGMNRDFVPLDKLDGNYGVWLGGDVAFKVAGANTNLFEFYQIIDKSLLAAGTYKVQCMLAVEDAKRTSQRLFANQCVQYHGTVAQYASNQTAGEVATFAGWGSSDKNLQEMKVYTTIGEDESLKIGVRTGNTKGDGTIAANANPLWGWFKVDYFRLVKIDPQDAANANLANITLSAGSLAFDAATNSYNVQLPTGTTSVTPTATAAIADVKVAGAGAIDVSSGAGVSTITVTALDGTTTKSYTVNYVVGGTTNLRNVKDDCAYKIVDRKLSVYGTKAYVVYSLNGVKVAEVNNNVDGTSVVLSQGAYIVKAIGGTTKVSKVIVK